jgi:NAD(P)-dependent dehydrogenase (short-subunit alcohol dehydrogenase family)
MPVAGKEICVSPGPSVLPSVDLVTSRVWLITGSSSGFGRHIARAALQRGDRVVATARHAPVDLVALAPDRVLALSLDVTIAEQIAAAVDAAVQRFGRIDVLVNAGYGSVGAVEEIDLADLRALMETMFFGAVALTQAVLPHMRAHRSGAIVQMSSMGGRLAPPGFGAYCSAKFALEAMSAALSDEVGPLGIRVLIVEPGAFRTEFGGARMHRSREIDAYAQSIGPTRVYIDNMDGTQPGDPRKAADAVLDPLDAPSAPLQLALGADAVDAIRAEHARRQADLDAWEKVSRDTVFG